MQLFKFHSFFDGLIGCESLRSLGAEILTSSNILKFPDYSIQMLRKYPDSFSVSLNAHEEVPVVLNTKINNGDFYIENPLPLTEDVMIVPGLYKANCNKAHVLLKNCCNFTVKCNPNRTIPSELNNFEERNLETMPKKEFIFDPATIDPKLRNQLRIDHHNAEEKDKLLKLISRYQNIFFIEGNDLTFTNVIKHKIETKDEIPTHAKSYRYPYCHKQEVQNQINKMLAQGIIRPSTSPWCSPIWIVLKKG